MSRIGKMPIKVLQGVKVEIKDRLVKVEGPKGKLVHVLPEGVQTKQESGELSVFIVSEDLGNLHGLTRTLLHNMVHGVHSGFTRDLDIVGVGFRAAMKGQVLNMTLGFSHPVEFTLPQGISGKVEGNTHIVISGADKALVGLIASQIRAIKPPEPYQGKGIKYTNEQITRKQGKAAGAK
jgi:large subunit ribosomal protein L6